MKNIYLLPTKQSSKLHLWTDENGSKLQLCELEYSHTRNTQNMYITSDEKVIPDSWVVYSNPNNGRNFVVKVTTINSTHFDYKRQTLDVREVPISWAKNIILTTDQKLIADKVQEVDDKFLEWFIKNPNCEEVKTLKFANSITTYTYVIMIPNEMSDTLLKAFQEGKTLQVVSFGHWKNFVPQNQLDSPNFEHSGIENWRIKPVEEEEEEVECNNCGYLMSLLSDNSIYVCTNSECTSCYKELEEERMYSKKELLEAFSEPFGQGTFSRDEYKQRVMNKLELDRFEQIKKQ